MPASRISPVPSGRSCAAVLLTPARYSEQLTVVPRSPGTTVNCSAAVPAVAPGLQRAHEGGVTLAAAAAQRGRAELAAAAAQLVHERDDEPGPRHADRVAECDGAAVDVHDVVVDVEVLHGGETDGGEGLVDLEKIDVGDRLVDGLERPLDRP